MKKVAVILLNYKDSENTIRLSREYENMNSIDRIIVIDNMSPDNSFSKMKKIGSKKIDVIQTEINGGYAKGNNFGIHYLNKKYGHFEYIIISNPDIYVEEKAIKACIDYLDKNKNIAICAPKMLTKDKIEHPLSGWQLRTIEGDTRDSSILLIKITKKYQTERYEKDYMNQSIIESDCIAGSFFIIRETIFKEIGYFDENTFLYFEEDILGKKIHDLGYKNIILNRYNFIHLESVSVDNSMGFMKKFMNLQKSKIYYHKNYNENKNSWKLFLLYFFTYFRYIEQCFLIVSIQIRKNLHYFNRWLLKIYKLFILFVAFLILPITNSTKKKNKKVLYFSLVNWKWIKQRPHFVPLYLCSHGYRVDYYFEEPYKKYIISQQNTLVENEHINENLTIKKWKFFPYHLKKSRLNQFIFATKSLFLNYDKVIFTNPKQINNIYLRILKLRRTKIYYECMDNYIYWEPNKDSIKFYEEKETYLVNVAEKIIVSSEGLKQMLIEKYNCNKDKFILIRNGYDKEVFENVSSSSLKLKHPCATYIGTIDEWFDFDVIIDYAKKYKDTNFYIIGPIGHTVEKKVANIKEKNIIFIGPIEHKYVPDVIKKSNVMLLPFIVNSLIEDVDPVKVYEYLYMQKPVVSSYWKELNQFENLVLFYKKKNEFEESLNKAFKTKINKTNEYKKLMQESAWDERLKEYLKAIK